MKTIVLQNPGEFFLTETETDRKLMPEEAWVRVHRIGICGTDMHAFRGKQPFFSYPRILGHELAVEVIEVGEKVLGLKPSEYCSVEPYLNCGTCIACRCGKTNCCTQLRVLGVHVDGGMREFMKIPANKLHPSPTLSLTQLALVETLGIGAHAVNRSGLHAKDTVLVIGAGPIGLSVIQFVQITGAKTVVIDQDDKRLTFCQQKFNISRTINNNTNNNTIEIVKELLSGDLPTLVFDATGNPQSMAKSFEYVAHGGKLIFVGLFQGDVTFHDPEFHKRELTLMASRNSTGEDFKRIIWLMEQGIIDITPWITHQSTLQEMISKFPSWLDPQTGVIKAMVEVE